MKITKKFALLAAATLMATGATAADNSTLMGYTNGAEVISVPVTEGRIDTISGIVYNQIKMPRRVDQLLMTVLQPRTDGLKPAVVYFPGGGFSSADHEKFIEMRMALAKAGFVVAAVQYRVVPFKFPALLEDGKAAVRFLKAHAAEYGVDPDRIAVLGDSAGGYLAEMMAATNGEKNWDKGDFLDVSSDIAAAVSFYGISDLTCVGEGLNQDKVHSSPAVTEALLVNGPAFGDFPGASITADKNKALNASPIGHIDGSEPPVLLMHGSEDTLVSPMQSKHLYEALKNKKVDADFVLVKGAHHGDDPWYQPQIIERVVSWFKSKLGDEKKVSGAKHDSSANL